MSQVVDTSVKTWGNGSAIRLSKELLAVAGFHVYYWNEKNLKKLIYLVKLQKNR